MVGESSFIFVFKDRLVWQMYKELQSLQLTSQCVSPRSTGSLLFLYNMGKNVSRYKYRKLFEEKIKFGVYIFKNGKLIEILRLILVDFMEIVSP